MQFICRPWKDDIEEIKNIGNRNVRFGCNSLIHTVVISVPYQLTS